MAFPTTLDDFTNPAGTDPLGTAGAKLHSTQHAQLNDAIEAIEAKIGIDGSAVPGSIDAKLGLVASGQQAESRAFRGAANGYAPLDASQRVPLANLFAALAALGPLTPATDRLPFFDGASSAALTPLTAFARGILDDVDAPAVRGTLGLGALATLASVGAAQIDDNAVGDTELRDSAALSVIGRSANSTGDPADIAAGADGQILRRSGTTLAFGALDLAAAAAITGDLPLANLTPATAASRLLGRGSAGGAGDWQEITLGANLTLTGTVLSASGGGSGGHTIQEDGSSLTARTNLNFRNGLLATDDAGNDATLVDLANDGVTDAILRNSAALSVIGRSANSSGDPADIAAANDGEVLRRSGTTLGFGTVATAGLANDAVTFAKLQNLTTDRLLGRDTAGTGDPEEISVGGGLEFTGSAGIQRSALTGDATASAGSGATTVVRASTRFALPGSAAPAQLTADTNNLDPTGSGVGSISTVFLDLDADHNLTGIVNTGAVDGHLLYVGNISAFTLTLVHASASSSADNRFELGGPDLSLPSGGWVLLRYDAGVNRWRGTSTFVPGAGVGAPVGAQYLVATSDGTLTNERVTTDTATVTWDHSVSGQAKANVPNDAITYAKIQNVSAGVRLLGRGDSGAGDVEEISLGAGLSMSGTQLEPSGLNLNIDWKDEGVSQGNGCDTVNFTGGLIAATVGFGVVTVATPSADGSTLEVSGSTLRAKDDGITNAKLANMAASTIKGRVTASTGDPEDLTAQNVRDITGLLGAGRRAITGASTVVAADRGYVIDATSGTFSLALTAAATLGAGFWFAVYNSGSGVVTVDPNGAETIRDASGAQTTVALAQGAGIIVFCDGSNFAILAQISASGGGGYSTIKNEGSGLTQRSNLDFIGELVSATDNSPDTDVTIAISNLAEETTRADAFADHFAFRDVSAPADKKILLRRMIPGGFSRWYYAAHIDFENGNNALGWGLAAQTSGAGSSSSNNQTTPSGNRIGVNQISTGTDTGGRTGFLTATSAFRLGDGTFYFASSFSVQTLSDGTDTFLVFCGLSKSASSTTPQDFVGFRINKDNNSGNAQGVTRSNNVESTLNCSATLSADTFATYEFIVNAAASSVEFFIDGTSQGTITTNIPSGSGREMGWQPINVIKTAGTTARTARIDFSSMLVEFATVR